MRIIVNVTPNAKQNGIISENIDLLGQTVINIKTPQSPENGRANKAVIDLLAKHFNIAKSHVSIYRGQHSRQKMIDILGITDQN